MDRPLICLIVMLSMLLLSGAALRMLDSSTDRIDAAVGRVIEAAASGDREACEEAAERLEELWREHYKTASMVSHTGILNDISYSVAKVRDYARSGSDELIPECKAIARLAGIVRDNQLPKLHTLL